MDDLTSGYMARQRQAGPFADLKRRADMTEKAKKDQEREAEPSMWAQFKNWAKETYEWHRDEAPGAKRAEEMRKYGESDEYRDYFRNSKPGSFISLTGALFTGMETGLSGISEGAYAGQRWAADTVGAVGSKLNVPALQELGTIWGEWADQGVQSSRKDIQRSQSFMNPEFLRGEFLENPSMERALTAIGGAAPSLGAAVAVSVSTGSPALGAVLLSSLEGSQAYVEAREAGEGYSHATKVGLLTTAVTTALEKYGLEKVMGHGGGTFATKLMKGAISEGGTEGLQEIAQNAIAIMGYDDARKWFQGTTDAFIGGFFAGGGMSAVVSSSEPVKVPEPGATVEGQKLSATLRKAREEGLVDQETLQVADYLAKQNPDMDEATRVSVANVLKFATDDILAQEGYTRETAMEAGLIQTGQNSYLPDTDQVVIDLYKGHAADTVVEEWYEAYLKRLSTLDPAAYQNLQGIYQDEIAKGTGQAFNPDTGEALSLNEWFGQNGRDFFMRTRVYQGAVRNTFRGLKERLLRLVGIVRQDPFATVHPYLEEQWRAAGMGEPVKLQFGWMQQQEPMGKAWRDAMDLTKITSAQVKSEEAITPRVLKDPPVNTVKAYKLFRVDENGTLYPLFVKANQPISVGQWLEAEMGEMNEKGKVKSKLGGLAFRPGWHAGDLPLATHIGGKADKNSKVPDHRPDNQVWAEVEMPADVDWQAEADKRMEMTQDGKPIPRTAQITDQVPAGGFYRYKTNPNMTGEWLIGGAMKVNRVLTDAEVKKINHAHGVADLPRLSELTSRGKGTSIQGEATGTGTAEASVEVSTLSQSEAAAALSGLSASSNDPANTSAAVRAIEVVPSGIPGTRSIKGLVVGSTGTGRPVRMTYPIRSFANFGTDIHDQGQWDALVDLIHAVPLAVRQAVFSMGYGSNKLEGQGLVQLSAGCGRNAAMIQAIENGLIPTEVLEFLTSCHGACYKNFDSGALSGASAMAEMIGAARRELANTYRQRRSVVDTAIAKAQSEVEAYLEAGRKENETKAKFEERAGRYMNTRYERLLKLAEERGVGDQLSVTVTKKGIKTRWKNLADSTLTKAMPAEDTAQLVRFVAEDLGITLLPKDIPGIPKEGGGKATDSKKLQAVKDAFKSLPLERKTEIFEKLVAAGLTKEWMPQETMVPVVAPPEFVREKILNMSEKAFLEIVESEQSAFIRGNQQGDWLMELATGTWQAYADAMLERWEMIKPGEPYPKKLSAVTAAWYADVPMDILEEVAQKYGDLLLLQVTGPIDFSPEEAALRIAGFEKLRLAGLNPIMRLITDEFGMGGGHLSDVDSIEQTLEYIVQLGIPPKMILETPLHIDAPGFAVKDIRKAPAVAERLSELFPGSAEEMEPLARGVIRWRNVFDTHEGDRPTGHEQVGLTYERLESLGVNPKLLEQMKSLGYAYPMVRDGESLTGLFPARCCTTGKCATCGPHCQARIKAELDRSGDTLPDRTRRLLERHSPTDVAALLQSRNTSAQVKKLPDIWGNLGELADNYPEWVQSAVGRVDLAGKELYDKIKKQGIQNLEYIDAEADTKAMMSELPTGKEAAKRIQDFRRQGIDIVESSKLPPQAIDLDVILDLEPGFKINEEMLYQIRVYQVAAFDNVAQIAQQASQVSDPKIRESLHNELAKAWALAVQLKAVAAGATATAGRSLWSMQLTATGDPGAKMLALEFLHKAFDRNATAAGAIGPETMVDMVVSLLEDPAPADGDNLDPGQQPKPKVKPGLKKIIEASDAPKFADMFYEYWINALLSGPKTHAVNLASAAVFSGWQIAERWVASKISGSVQAEEASIMARAAVEGWWDAFKLAAVAYREGKTAFTKAADATEDRRAITAANIAERLGNPALASNPFIKAMDLVAEHLVRAPTKMLAAEDTFAATILQRMEYKALSWRTANDLAAKEAKQGYGIIDGNRVEPRTAEVLYQDMLADPNEALMEDALTWSRSVTFQLKLGQAGTMANAALRQVPGVRYILPFVRTPTNILKEVAVRTPLGAVGGLLIPQTKIYQELHSTDKATRDIAIAKIGLGSGAMTAIMGLVATGLVTGGPPTDRKLREALERNGVQWYSVRFPGSDTWIAYNRLDPVGSIFGTAADFAYTMHSAYEMDDDLMTRIPAALVLSLTRNMTSKTYLTGLSKAIEAITDETGNAMSRWGEHFSGSWIPNIMNQTAQAADPYRRKADGIIERAMARTWWWRDDVPIMVDRWGRDVESDPMGWVSIVTPWYAQTNDPNRVDTEIVDVVQKGGKISGLNQWDGWDSIQGNPLSREQEYEYRKLAGRRAYVALLGLIAGEEDVGGKKGTQWMAKVLGGNASDYKDLVSQYHAVEDLTAKGIEFSKEQQRWWASQKKARIISSILDRTRTMAEQEMIQGDPALMTPKWQEARDALEPFLVNPAATEQLGINPNRLRSHAAELEELISNPQGALR